MGPLVVPLRRALLLRRSWRSRNPFKLVSGTIPLDGRGPNPLLQNHPLMAFHPPFLYLGYVGFTIPFSFAIAALITGRFGEGWLADTRRTTLIAWGFLTVGIVLGAWWSYEVLGWGGYWGWDPVENASLLPWLTATAFIHSVIVQERRGMLRVWNLSLVLATFCLTILGTFLTRSGVIELGARVHRSPPSARGCSRFLGVVVVDRPRARSPGGRTSCTSPGPHRLAGLARVGVPREQPAVHRARVRGAARHGVPVARRGAAGQARSRSASRTSTRMTTPIGLALLFLMAVAPASAVAGRERRGAPATGCSIPAYVGVGGDAADASCSLARTLRGRRRVRARGVRVAGIFREIGVGGAQPARKPTMRAGRGRAVGTVRGNPRRYGGLHRAHRRGRDRGRARVVGLVRGEAGGAAAPGQSATVARLHGHVPRHVGSPSPRRRRTSQRASRSTRAVPTSATYAPAISHVPEQRPGHRHAVGAHRPPRDVYLSLVVLAERSGSA